MKFVSTSLPEVYLIEPNLHEDQRGFFMETWRRDLFAKQGIDAEFVQDNHSRSMKGTVRGLHYQVRQPQGKLIRVIVGQAFDVAVDLRRSSPRFGHWTGTTLSEENKRLIWIPAGFAHGCLISSDSADFEYRCTQYYAPEHERTIRWDDPDIGIDWPLRNGQRALLSEKDQAGAWLSEAEVYA